MSSKLTRIKEELKEAGMTTTGHVIMLIKSSSKTKINSMRNQRGIRSRLLCLF